MSVKRRRQKRKRKYSKKDSTYSPETKKRRIKTSPKVKEQNTTKEKKKKKKYREHELRVNFHKWNKDHSSNEIVSCGTPYTCLRPRQAKFVQREGYQKGYPDYIRLNPTLKVYKSTSGKVRLEFCPAMFIEFKNPDTGGRLSEDQKEIMNTLSARGYHCVVSNSLDYSIDETKRYDGRIPMYKGFVELDLDNETVSFPNGQGRRTYMDIEHLPVRKPNVIVID